MLIEHLASNCSIFVFFISLSLCCIEFQREGDEFLLPREGG
jgi:hypothetical protein